MSGSSMLTSAPEGVILKLEEVEAGYGEDPILKGVSLDVPKGKVTTLIGPNGAGKSTLLRAVFGTVKVTHGRIVYNGKAINGISSTDRLHMGIAYCSQGRCNFPNMTVRENLEMGAYIRSDRSVRADIEELLDLFPLLRNREREFAGNLSGGQQQVLEMAMALVLRPKLLLIDEPSIGLSPIMVDEVFRHVQEIKGQGVTMLMVEQNARRALAVSDFGAVLELGHVIFEDTGEAILKNEEIRRRYLGSGRTNPQRSSTKGQPKNTSPS
jgi:branched-chain amino acid transport system ATP-binding protein